MSPTKRKRSSSDAMFEEIEVCTLREQPPARVEIDPDGDLCLKVGYNKCNSRRGPNGQKHDHEHAVIYVVDSKALSRSSPVWKAMLNKGFAESKRPEPGQDWIVEFLEEDPKAMLIILNIIHNRYGDVPRGEKAMPIHSLYRLTVLTDKYGLTSLLQPWAQTWTKGLKDKLPGNRKVTSGKSSLTLNCLERLLWIAWELGNEQLFRGVYGYLVLNTTVEEGHLIEKNFKTKPFSTGISKPPAVCEHIKAERGKIISNILGVFNSKIDSFVFGDSQFCKHRPIDFISGDDKQSCEAIMNSKFMKWLGCNKLWPLPDARDVHSNGIHLAALVTCSQLAGHRKECHTFQDGEIASILDPMNISLPENFKTHLETQAKKSGLDQQSELRRRNCMNVRLGEEGPRGIYSECLTHKSNV
ncbi:hypothetical protein DL770_005344 [Monosporascus sp. CRB-9-2]|nr:hypothetical protein DL770_005344 [Monosporascus sp. CRB-9-2]